MYDYLVVGAGLFGAVFAHEAKKAGKKVLVIDKREHVAGNIYTKEVDGIQVHEYGAHIFHTNNKKVWEYINKFVVDKRTGEWVEDVNPDNTINKGQALVHPWKCPYHNGRMCIEMIRRLEA